MARSQRYPKVLEIAQRVHELQDEYGWTKAQVLKALGVFGEPTSYNLHFMGRYSLNIILGPLRQLDVAFEPVMRSQASDELLAEYGDLIEHRGIIG